MIGIIKTNDLRNEYLCKYFRTEKYIYSNDLKDFYNLDILILNFSGMDTNYYLKQTDINLKELIKQNRSLRLVVTGVANKELENLCLDNDILLLALMNNKKFVAHNAMLTAEGILRVISNDLKESFSDLNILVLGYGYVGESITKHLNFYNDISIYTIDQKEEKSVLLSKNKLVNNLDKLNYDLIINTIPVNLIKADVIINKSTKIYDVSSYPYGFNEEMIKNVKVVPQIPGNILPKSAAKLIFDIIEDELKK